MELVTMFLTHLGLHRDFNKKNKKFAMAIGKFE